MDEWAWLAAGVAGIFLLYKVVQSSLKLIFWGMLLAGLLALCRWWLERN